MAHLILESEAKERAQMGAEIQKGFITALVSRVLGKPTGYPEAFILYETSNKIEAFKLMSAPDNFEGQKTVWAGWLPKWAK